MTHEELEAFRDRFHGILKSPERIQNNRLIMLMEDMEQCYNIPLLYDAAYVKNNPEVMHLYRSVSKVRNLREVK